MLNITPEQNIILLLAFRRTLPKIIGIEGISSKKANLEVLFVNGLLTKEYKLTDEGAKHVECCLDKVNNYSCKQIYT